MNEDTQSPSNGMAIASLVFSILSIILGPLGFIPGIICGHIARAQNKRNPKPSGDGLALAGLIIGYVFLVFMVLSLILFSALTVTSVPN